MKINTLELEKIIDKNLKSFFKPLIDSDIKHVTDEKYYHLLDQKLYFFLDEFFEKVDSMNWECLENLKDNLGQYVYISYYGEPVDIPFMMNLIDDVEYHDDAFRFADLDNLADCAKWGSEEIEEGEPIRADYIFDLGIQSILELYNKKT